MSAFCAGRPTRLSVAEANIDAITVPGERALKVNAARRILPRFPAAAHFLHSITRKHLSQGDSLMMRSHVILTVTIAAAAGLAGFAAQAGPRQSYGNLHYN